MLYLRFIICLAVGLLGMALVLSTVMDAVLVDWDVAADMRGFINRLSRWDEGSRESPISASSSRKAAQAEAARTRQFLAPIEASSISA